MADIKRQSVGNRVATPKLGAYGPVELDVALAKAVGARVKLTTSSPSLTLEGIIFTTCPITNIVAINTAAATATTSSTSANIPGDYHLIHTSRVQSFSIVSLATSLADSITSAAQDLSKVDFRAVKAREETAIRKIKEKDATRGKGVTKEGQEIYDQMWRTLPIRWHNTDMIVSDSVRIVDPYRVEDCSAPKNQQTALVRVKQVLAAEREKIAERASKTAAGKAATPSVSGVRKGG